MFLAFVEGDLVVVHGSDRAGGGSSVRLNSYKSINLLIVVFLLKIIYSLNLVCLFVIKTLKFRLTRLGVVCSWAI
jgi:hypothetical protein